MKLLLANPRGFCAGVRMATQALQLALEKLGPPIYVYHEIVHNQHVVNEFQQQGAIFVDSLEEVPPESVLVYSAHGVSPEVKRQAKARRLQTIDAICPLVSKVHAEAIRFARLGRTIVLIGHAGHDEITGTIGEAPDAIELVSSVEDVERLDIAPETKLAWLTQTTLSVTDTQAIVARLRERFPQIESPPTADICYATSNRQLAVRSLCAVADAVVVVGSQNSSNSQRLFEIAAESGIAAGLIDTPDALRAGDFREADTVVVTAGASVPESAVESVVQWFQTRFEVEIESQTFAEEEQVFSLPRELVTGRLARQARRHRTAQPARG